MPEKAVRIDLVATDHASDVVSDVADEVEALERLDPEVEVTADTRQAARAITDVADEARELSAKDQEIVLKAQVSDARAGLKELQGDLNKTESEADQTRKAVDDIGSATGPRIAGNTVSDLTGPLGEASSAASDVGGVFDGLGDSAEAAWIKMGGSEQTAAKLASSLGVAGFAVSAGVALWTQYRQAQQKAEEQQRKIVESAKAVRDALREQDFGAAADRLVADYEDIYDAAHKMGIGAGDVTAYITGQTDALPELDQAMADVIATYDDLEKKEILAGLAGDTHAETVIRQQEAIEKARESWAKANGTLADQDARLKSVTDALQRSRTKTDDFATAQEKAKRKAEDLKGAMDRLQGSLNMERAMLNFTEDFTAAMASAQDDTALTGEEILDLKQDILDVAEFANLNPVYVQSLLERVEAGDLAGVKRDVEWYYNNSPAQVATNVKPPSDAELRALASKITTRLQSLVSSMFGSGPAPAGTTTARATGTSVVNVTQYVPRGYHGDLLTDARSAARRHGGLYQRNAR